MPVSLLHRSWWGKNDVDKSLTSERITDSLVRKIIIFVSGITDLIYADCLSKPHLCLNRQQCGSCRPTRSHIYQPPAAPQPCTCLRSVPPPVSDNTTEIPASTALSCMMHPVIGRHLKMHTKLTGEGLKCWFRKQNEQVLHISMQLYKHY